MDELKPCPCCGEQARFEHDMYEWYWIVCGGCGLATNQMVSTMDDCKPLLAEKWNRRAALAATQAGWISVKDRLPEKNTMVLCAVEFDGPGDWRIKTGYLQDMPDFNDWYIFGGSWSPSHWRELPAAPESSEKEET